MAKVMDRAFYMTEDQKKRMGKLPRRHNICRYQLSRRNKDGEIIEAGPARPGKTAQDRARKGK